MYSLFPGCEVREKREHSVLCVKITKVGESGSFDSSLEIFTRWVWECVVGGGKQEPRKILGELPLDGEEGRGVCGRC
jgi:hypothetical protein